MHTGALTKWLTAAAPVGYYRRAEKGGTHFPSPRV